MFAVNHCKNFHFRACPRKTSRLSFTDLPITRIVKRCFENKINPLNYTVEIKKINSFEKIPVTHFHVIDHKLTGHEFKVLVKYRSQENPEIQALFDEAKNKVYLVGGKNR